MERCFKFKHEGQKALYLVLSGDNIKPSHITITFFGWQFFILKEKYF